MPRSYQLLNFRGQGHVRSLENKIENYKIFAGEEASYLSYDINGNPVNDSTPPEQLPTYNGIIRPGGSQGFPGYAPENEVDRNRSNFSIYLDTEIDLTNNLFYFLDPIENKQNTFQ